jgi:trigger factor
MKYTRITAILLSFILAVSAFSGCSSKNSDKFYGTDSSSSDSTSSDSDSSTVDITTEYSLEIPKYDDYFKLGDHTDITYYINDSTYDVTDEDVLNAIAEDLDFELVDVTDRGAKNGDTVDLTFEGLIDGEAFDGNKAENQTIVLGEGSIASDFESQLVGMKTGETKTIEYTFSEDYTDSSIAGKTAEFTVTMNSIQEYTANTLTDDYVSENTDYDTVDEYKKYIRSNLEKENEEQKHQDISAIILSKIMDNSEVIGYDEDEVASLIESAESATSTYAESYDMTEEEFVQTYYGFDSYDAYEESLTETTHNYLNNLMLISAIAYAEDLTVTDDEYQAQIDEYINEYGITKDQLNAYYTSEDIIFSILVTKVEDWLVDNSVRLDEPEETDSSADSASDASSAD